MEKIEIQHDSFLDVFVDDYIYDVRVGYNICNALFWNPADFSVAIKKVDSIDEYVEGFPKSRRFVMRYKTEKSSTTQNVLIRSRVMSSSTEVRIFEHIYFGSVLESKIVFQDVGTWSRFYICDTDFLNEVLDNMREDYFLIQKQKMREMKQKMKIFNQRIRSIDSKLSY